MESKIPGSKKISIAYVAVLFFVVVLFSYYVLRIPAHYGPELIPDLIPIVAVPVLFALSMLVFLLAKKISAYIFKKDANDFLIFVVISLSMLLLGLFSTGRGNVRLAIISGNAEFCDKIGSFEIRNECFMLMSEIMKEDGDKACDKIGEVFLKNKCYISIANKLNSLRICEKITGSESAKKECRNGVEF
ncbi:MAG: hypothetical protein WA093_02930 [Minisyncoccales bacterium]